MALVRSAGPPGTSAASEAGVLKYAPPRFSSSPMAAQASASMRMLRDVASNSPRDIRPKTSQSIAAKRTALP